MDIQWSRALTYTLAKNKLPKKYSDLHIIKTQSLYMEADPIIKHWNSIWITKYVPIKVARSFPCTSPYTPLSIWLHACLSIVKTRK